MSLRTLPLTLTCTLTCTLTLAIALTLALTLDLTLGPNQETGVLSEHVYVGLPWERPTAMGCCYFHARDVSRRPFEPATHGIGLQAGCRQAGNATGCRQAADRLVVRQAAGRLQAGCRQAACRLQTS